MVARVRSVGYSLWLAVLATCFAYSYFALERVLPQDLSGLQTAAAVISVVLATQSVTALTTCLTRSLRGEPVAEAAGQWRVGLYSFTGCVMLFGLVLSAHMPADDAFPMTLIHSVPAIAGVVVTAFVSQAIRPQPATASRRVRRDAPARDVDCGSSWHYRGGRRVRHDSGTSAVLQARRTGRIAMRYALATAAAGTFLVSGGIWCVILIFTDPGSVPPWGWLVTLAAWVLGLASVVYANSMARYADRYFIETAPPADPIGPGHVLYLRSFHDDERLSKPQRHPPLVAIYRAFLTVERSEEQHLVCVEAGGPSRLRRSARTEPTACGRTTRASDRRLESINSANDAQRRVGRDRARKHDGVIWELAEAVRTLPPERIMLVVPMSRREYDKFCVKLPQRLREVLAEDPVAEDEEWSFLRLPKFAGREQALARIRGLVRMSEDGSASFVAVQHYAGWYNSLDEMLYRAMKEELPVRNVYEGDQPEPAVSPLQRLVACLMAVASVPFFAKLGVLETGSAAALFGWLGHLAIPFVLAALAATLWTGSVGQGRR